MAASNACLQALSPPPPPTFPFPFLAIFPQTESLRSKLYWPDNLKATLLPPPPTTCVTILVNIDTL